jgi:hypothetical protein
VWYGTSTHWRSINGYIILPFRPFSSVHIDIALVVQLVVDQRYRMNLKCIGVSISKCNLLRIGSVSRRTRCDGIVTNHIGIGCGTTAAAAAGRNNVVTQSMNRWSFDKALLQSIGLLGLLTVVVVVVVDESVSVSALAGYCYERTNIFQQSINENNESLYVAARQSSVKLRSRKWIWFIDGVGVAFDRLTVLRPMSW